MRIAITGASGSLANDIIPGLVALGHTIVAIDVRGTNGERPGVREVVCSVNDRPALAAAIDGCDAVVHLAGIPLEAEWSEILSVNVDGTQAILEAARERGVARVVLASSIHAAGFVPTPEPGGSVPDDVQVSPNTFYGASKAMAEALGALYHARHGMDVVCLRIASRFARPENERMLSTWLSPGDATRLVQAALTVPDPGFRLVWGVSANRASVFSREGGNDIGYHPQDDAADHAAEVAELVRDDPTLALSEWDRNYIGGVFSSPQPPRFVPFAERGQS